MKKLFVLVMALLPAMIACADGDRPIDFGQLPAPAQKFVKTHFPKAKVALVTVEKDWRPSYDVRFDDGSHIEFDSSGQWKDIDCNSSAVPAGVIPAKIAAFVKEKYPEAFVTEIDKDRRGYDVKLNNRLELHFDKNGAFRGYDD